MTEGDGGAGKPVLMPLDVGQWSDDEYAAVGALFGIPGEEVPRAGSGHARDPLNFDILGVLTCHPKMARVFMSYNAFLLQRGELPLRLRELAILRLAHARRSAFFWGEHVRVATAGGLSQTTSPALPAATTSSTVWTGWCSMPPTRCSPTAESRRRHGNASSRNSAHVRRWNLSSPSRRTGCWRWRAIPGSSFPRWAARSCRTDGM
jgi:hypothetical protein